MKQHLLLLPVLIAGPCIADDNWYVGIGAGIAEYDKGQFQPDDTLLQLSGGFRFNTVFAVEAAYVDLGDVQDRALPEDTVSLAQDTLAMDVRGIKVAPALRWEVLDSFFLSGRLGVAVLDIDKEWSGGTVVDPQLANDTGGTETEMFGGVRVQYSASDAVSVGLSWDRYEVEDIDVDGIYATIGYSF